MYRLLIVEDEELLRKSLCVMIDWEDIGIQVAGAVENGIQALEFLADHPADIVMTDIRMPAMDGLELACEIQSRYPQIKTVLCSAYSEFSFAQKGIEYGVYGYLLKSQDEEEIAGYFREMCKKLEREALYQPLESAGRCRPDLWERREEFALGLLHEPQERKDLLKEASSCRMELGTWPVTAMRIHLDDAELLREELGGTGIRQLEKILGEQLLTEVEWQGRGYLLKTADEALVLWTDWKEGFLRRQEELRQALIKELNAFESTTRITLTLALGAPAREPGELHRSVETAGEALRSKYYLGGDRIIETCPGERWEEQAVSYEDSGRRLQRAERCCHERDAAALCTLLMETRRDWLARRVTDRHSVELFAMKLILLLSDTRRNEARQLSRSGELIHSIAKLETLDEVFERLELAGRELLSEGEAPEGKQPKRLVEKAIDFMRQNYSGDISLERTAAYVNVHPVHLSRLFRQETSQTFKGILTQLRIDAAKELLNDLDLRVYEISERVGYQKPRYFSELFKEVTGMTPLEYREKR